MLVRLDSDRSLPELTAAVDMLCEEVENLSSRTVAVLRVLPAPL
ncbi:hypothetical protein [Streptomyces rapamycinicus]|uniref:Uncharacterized protein n=1 Tax=Streptomyces rapamycinicus TaxID=1226757 RepID=A0ABR6LA74_9ACTN|nr:hypothetical protein [Streptomyces rapamycinicus]AGP51686.1 hypothetical protein M271_00235 [Streptomyces rapamycinicus NRRL 5491]MBB4779094.1 hypothetical protein [Streptomyces rapamycinicus]